MLAAAGLAALVGKRHRVAKRAAWAAELGLSVCLYRPVRLQCRELGASTSRPQLCPSLNDDDLALGGYHADSPRHCTPQLIVCILVLFVVFFVLLVWFSCHFPLSLFSAIIHGANRGSLCLFSAIIHGANRGSNKRVELWCMYSWQLDVASQVHLSHEADNAGHSRLLLVHITMQQHKVMHLSCKHVRVTYG